VHPEKNFGVVHAVDDVDTEERLEIPMGFGSKVLKCSIVLPVNLCGFTEKRTTTAVGDIATTRGNSDVGEFLLAMMFIGGALPGP
jgi:hypothetical protein